MSLHFIDFERDWAGEARRDPDDNNTYVLRSVGYDQPDPQMIQSPVVRVNDVFGGHFRTLPLNEWLRWEK